MSAKKNGSYVLAGNYEALTPTADGSAKVSAYFPTPGDGADGQLAVKIDRAAEQVADPELRRVIRNELPRALSGRAVDAHFDTLCVFLSRDGIRLAGYDRPVPPTIAIDETYFLKPIAPSLSGADQFLVFRSRGGELELFLGDLMGQRLLSVVRGEGTATQLRRAALVRFARRTRLPIYVAGRVEELRGPESTRVSESGADEPGEFRRLFDDARARLREHQASRSHVVLREIEGGRVRTLSNVDAIAEAVRGGHAQELLLDACEWEVREAAPRELNRQSAPGALRLDDLVEHAIRRRLRVTPIYGLQEKVGHPQAAVLDVIA